ncbi:MAG: FAD/NAD(P)-binding oxidoreductase [Planctomycetota bacterium]
MKAERHDVIVIGGGPAGLEAASAAAESGAAVAILDDNPAFGGQIWREDVREGADRKRARVAETLRALEARGAVLLPGATVFDAEGPTDLRVIQGGTVRRLRSDRLILATGARELFLPFPGWTLPGVVGVGGLQALVKSGLEVRGRAVVLAGTGPLLYAVARDLRRRGAEVRALAEQAPAARIARFGLSLWRQPAKMLEGLLIYGQPQGLEIAHETWPREARGDATVRSVVLEGRGGRTEVPCDLLAVGFGLVPDTRLARLLGCATARGAVSVDEDQATSVPGVFAAGEITGVGGVDKAVLEGAVAGLAATDALGRARGLRRPLAREIATMERMRRAFRLRPELRALADDDTILCRCEDVTVGAARGCRELRDLKLKTRCGMGACQGRVCHPAARFLLELGDAHDRVRPPLFPVPLAALLASAESEDPES